MLNFESNNNLREIIMTKIADLKGNNKEDIVYLIGEKVGIGKGTIYSNLDILISDGDDGKISTITLGNLRVYNPKMVIGKHISDKLNSILFMSESVDNKNHVCMNIFDFEGDKPIKVFDSEYFYRDDLFDVTYEDDEIISIIDNKENKLYKINISFKDEIYLNEIYSKNRKLKKLIKGKIMPINDIYILNDGISDLNDIIIKQKIVGTNEEDDICQVLSRLRFNGKDFEKIETTISILNKKFISNFGREIKEDEDYDFSKIEIIESEEKNNSRIERIIEKEFNLDPSKDKLNYFYNRVKLKDENKNQILVYLEGPKFCSENGGSIIIIEEKNNEYRITSKIINVINPIIISESKTNEYKDLIIKTLCKGKEEFRVLKFNGNSYPGDPLKEEKLKRGSNIKGVSVISDDLFYIKGLEYK